MIETFDIAGYTRISVDDELDQKNISIENQKAIIEDFVKQKFSGSSLTFYEDRDRSGYTFEQREGYQAMRKKLVAHQYVILIVKDFSRFSRRNSRGLVELEDLRDAGVRIISIGDGIDFPNDDDWLKIQFQFLINEMPVTDTSKKVRNVIKRRQADRVLDQSIGIPVQKILARHDTVPQLPFRLPTGHSGNIAAAPGDLFAFGERIGFFLL